ncbi:MAG: hypothetical protein K2X98_02180, partial [Alphaproteobacteria bacterium]|nr:hypothetical protein [Alphaproteobacteria bacterium]
IGKTVYKEFITLPVIFSGLIAAIIWTIISCGAGYLLGDIVEKIILNMDTIQKYFAFILLGVICAIAGMYYAVKKFKGRTKT